MDLSHYLYLKYVYRENSDTWKVVRVRKMWCCVWKTTARNLDQGLNILGQSQCVCDECVCVYFSTMFLYTICVFQCRRQCLAASALLRNKFAIVIPHLTYWHKVFFLHYHHYATTYPSPPSSYHTIFTNI